MIKQIQEIEIEVIRKNVKNINLAVLPPDGRVRVSVPFGLSEERLTEFLRSKTDWIRVHREKVIERAAKKEAASALRNPEMSEEGRKELVKRYRAILRPKLEEYLEFWERQTGLHPEKWQMRDMKTRWGSCNPRTKKLWFSVGLAEKSDECIEYVVLHELAHLKIANHGADFKAFLTHFMPDWRVRQKQLNGH